MSIEQQEPKVQTQSSATQRRYRTLAVVRQEAITRVEKPLEDSVFVWPHLLVREFFAATIVMVMLTLLSLQIDAPLRDPANPNVTPNPAKAPWYFLGLQELLHYFEPTTAGVLVPGLVLLGLVVLPYVDRNPSRAYADRKLAIVTFTMFAVFWAVITLAGSFFRGVWITRLSLRNSMRFCMAEELRRQRSPGSGCRDGASCVDLCWLYGGYQRLQASRARYTCSTPTSRASSAPL